ncbi:transcription factor TFIIIB subunit brf1, partial [Dispira simplex]
MACLNCGSNKIEYDAAAGNAFCVSCGAVTEENTIVSEITFGESATGAAILQGTLVSNDSGRLAINVHYGKRNSVQSREKTLVNGRRVINHIATALNMSERYQEAAHRYFNLAVNANFNKGRPTQNVASVCLYIVCRQEKASYLLIDFSELLQVSVFSLGVTFVKLVRELNLILPMVDPSLYITRFAMLLEFGDKTQRVVADALRLVQRMDRDWIQTGRRPAGICGACLLVASRMHNFRRSCNEIIRVVKVSSQTIQERLKEFKQTPTSKLSLDDFRNVWLEEANDPPAFTRNRSRKRGRPGSKGDDIPLHTTVRHDDPRQWVYEQDPFDIAGMAEQKLEPGDELLLIEINKYVGNSQLRLLSQEMVQKREELPATPDDTGDKPEQKDPFSTDVGDWQDFDDDEVIHAILSATEVEEKTALWMVNNANYLKEQELKKALNDTRAMNIGQRKKRAKPGSSRIEPSTTA